MKDAEIPVKVARFGAGEPTQALDPIGFGLSRERVQARLLLSVAGDNQLAAFAMVDLALIEIDIKLAPPFDAEPRLV